MLESSKYWFRAKRYGWGWGLPCAWQGWAVLTGYVLVIAGILRFLAPTHRIGLVLLCAAAGYRCAVPGVLVQGRATALALGEVVTEAGAPMVGSGPIR